MMRHSMTPLCLHPEQILPPANTVAAKAAVLDLLEEWHLQHYDMNADIEARNKDASVQHLSFLFGVRFCLGCCFE
jgi:hypothetical protein